MSTRPPGRTGRGAPVIAPTADAPGPRRPRAALPGWARRLASANETWTSGVLLLLVAFFTAARPDTFLTRYDLTQIATNAAIYLVLGVGMTYVIIVAGIDLSVGSVLVLSAVLSAEYTVHHGGAEAGWGTVAVSALIALATGLLWGALQGWLVAKAKVPPLIVTLGGFGAALGIAQVVTGGQDPTGAVPSRLQHTVGFGKLFGQVPWLVVIAFTTTLVFGLVLTRTRFGRHTYAIGSNPEAARRVGIDVDRHLVKVYALTGLLAGLGSTMWLAYFGTTSIAGHSTDNLKVITAVVLGGASLFGGRGTVLGTVIGVFIPAVLTTGLIIMDVQQYWQDVAIGVVLVAAVYLDQFRRRGRERG
ncbi:ABC transporter permease [Kitasatospora cineracea]|uniref:Autoinducer 2 import system permease protein LsrD n=1 Tax=Kitasatospora cineracea TaxID=88074 RepID=A0A3N4R2Z0_9ACTN|nr:ABC transporter permease [Kitasatospora cineracea]ROR35648.1 monosaccharide ABC transporter membrane protein (CUT2 family) [Kitasatospora cineracea]RPE27738.1 monosaccharide ABC transporter membrane protein (CUT2 family) [Kitasatospora cineracea]